MLSSKPNCALAEKYINDINSNRFRRQLIYEFKIVFEIHNENGPVTQNGYQKICALGFHTQSLKQKCQIFTSLCIKQLTHKSLHRGTQPTAVYGVGQR